MAQKPDGKSARTERVTFTRPAAERIAKVVRAVEGGDRDQAGITYGSAPSSQQKTFRVCTFTGAWSINASKTVTFKYQTTPPNTVSAMNLFFPITNTATATRDCAIAKDGTAWFLIDVPLATATAVFITSTATATFFGTDSTSQITFVTGVSASLNTTDCTISVSAATSTAISVSMAGTQTMTFLQTTATATYLTFG